jgi:hypothetical protein
VARVRLSKFAMRRVATDRAADLIGRALREAHLEAYAIARSGTYATGRLAESLTIRGPEKRGWKVEGSLGTELGYANAVHDGAKIHYIFPKAAPGYFRFGARTRPQLKFFWRRVGRVVYMPHIPAAPSRIGRSHPGIAHGKHFLTIPLEIVGRRYNLRVTNTP